MRFSISLLIFTFGGIFMKLENLYHTKAKEYDNIMYSIDMLRLKTYISYSRFSEIEFRFSTCWKNYVKKNFSSSQIKNFFYNYVIETEEGNSFWFGFLHNSENRRFEQRKREAFTNDVYNLTIEFNPNKIRDFFILYYLFNLSSDWYLVSYDLAFDVKVSILDLIWDLSGKHLEKIDNRGYDRKTVYIGTGDGRIKIYNKKNESNLEITGDLTRIEMSRSGEDFEIRKIKIWKYDELFPCVYLNNYIYSLSDYSDKTLLAVLFAVQNGYPLRNLTRYMRDKIKRLLEGGYKIRFSSKIVEELLFSIITYYFANSSVKWW